MDRRVRPLRPGRWAWQRPPAGDAEQQLRQLELDWTAAEINRDADALGRMLDEHFVSTFGAGKPVGKQEYMLSVIGADADPIVSEDLSDQTIVVAGDSAAVAELDTVHALRGGKPYTEVLRITTSYAKRDGRWVALAEHVVSVPGPAAGTIRFDAEQGHCGLHGDHVHARREPDPIATLKAVTG